MKEIDALKLTKFYLEGFRSQQQHVINLAENIEDNYTETIKLCATYGEQIGHSSIVKLEGGAKLAENEEHQQQRNDYAKAKHLSEQIERAVEGLPEAEKVIISRRYINREREAWANIAESLSYDESHCYRLHNLGLRTVATELFGIPEVLKAEEDKRLRRSRQ